MNEEDLMILPFMELNSKDKYDIFRTCVES